jgi:hypothetical protein
MIFQLNLPPIEEMLPFIIAISLICGDIVIFKICLTISKAEVKSSFKWVAASFGLQFGLIFFISTPIILEGITSGFSNGGPDPGLIVLVVIFSFFIDLNLINVIHKIGLKRSLLVAILIMGPITYSMYLIGSNLGSLIY